MAYRDQQVLLDGAITIYRRDSEGGKFTSDSWYAAIKIQGHPTKRLSLKTASKQDAILSAQHKHYDLVQRSLRGLTLSPKSFGAVANRYLEHYEKQVQIWETLDSDGRSNMEDISSNRLKNMKPLLQKYLIPFFSGMAIQEITQKDVEDYASHRLGYWTTKEQLERKLITYNRNGRKVIRPKRQAEKSVPSHSTINKELTVIRKVFTYAQKENLISPQEIPVIKRLKKPSGYDQKRERPSFTRNELALLLDTVRLMLANQTNPKHWLAHYRLYLYIQLMCFSGMRVTEAKNLRFSDTQLVDEELPSEHFSIWVTGKNKGRNLVAFTFCDVLVDLHLKLTQDLHLKLTHPGRQIMA